MLKLKTPYRNIYDVLRTNRFIVLVVVVCCLLTSIFSITTVLRFNNKMLNSAFAVNTDGSIITMKLVSEKENLKIEALNHLYIFHNYFYGIDEGNYKRNLEKALWLGDSTVDEVYRQKKSDGVYNRLLQYSLTQKVIEVDSQIDLTEAPYSFRTKTIFELNRGSVIDRYELITTGKLKKGSRHFPNNPHGLLITDFFENYLKKLNDETR